MSRTDRFDPNFDPAQFDLSRWTLGYEGIPSSVHRDSAAAKLNALASAVDARESPPPDGLIEETLLLNPDDFGDELQPILHCARESVLAEGGDADRARLESASKASPDLHAIERARRVLRARPGAVERSTPALVRQFSDSLVVMLAHPVPGAGERLVVRMHIAAHPEAVTMRANRMKDISAQLEHDWNALGHRSPPHSAWLCETPSWCESAHQRALELVPNPWSFNQAMYIAMAGGGRVLVVTPECDFDRSGESALAARVLPSSWSYLRADRTMGSCDPSFPNGAPAIVRGIRVPDADLFALCAAKTATVTLRDAIWLRNRIELRAIE